MGCYSILKRHEHAHDDAIWALAWASPTTLITGSLDTTAKSWSVQSQGGQLKLTEDRVWESFSLGVISIDKAPNSSVIAIADLASRIRLFDLDKPIEASEIRTIDASPVDSWKIKFSPDGKQIATGNVAGFINVYTLCDNGEVTKSQLNNNKFAYSVDFSPDGKLLAASNVAGQINIFDVETGKNLKHINSHALPVRCVAFSPDSKMILSGCDDTQIKVHDTNQFEAVKTLSGHGSWVLDMSFSPNGMHLASGSSDKLLKIWDLSKQECIQTFAHHTNQVTGVMYDPSGTKLASVSDDCSIAIYDHIK